MGRVSYFQFSTTGTFPCGHTARTGRTYGHIRNVAPLEGRTAALQCASSADKLEQHKHGRQTWHR